MLGWLSSRQCVTGSTEVDRAANISMSDNLIIATPNIQNVSDKRNYSVGNCCTAVARYRFAGHSRASRLLFDRWL